MPVGGRIQHASKPDLMVPSLFRVARRRVETADTVTLELEPPEEGRLPFTPGQFNMLYAFGVGEVPISISGNPGKVDRVIHTLRSVGPVTRRLAALKKGETVGVRGPFGSGWPLSAAVGFDVIIVAGGIGLAPLRPAIYELCANRERYGNVSLLYGARTNKDLLFTKEFVTWAGRHRIDVQVTVDQGSADWTGNVGVVTTLVARAGFDPEHTVAMICGPEIMARFSVLELRKAGIPRREIYISMERNMKCAVGHCGHCQFGPEFVCKDGPVFPFDRIRPWFIRDEV